MKLACDLATVTGYAAGTVAGVAAFGRIELPRTGSDLGGWLDAALNLYGSCIARLGPTEVWYEQPIFRMATNLNTLRKIYTLGPALELCCQRAGLPCFEAQLGDIRKHFLGVSRPHKRDAVKIATKVRCRERGWDVKDDNEADALALLDYALALADPNFAERATPLFARG